MAILEIVKDPAEVLRKKAKPVTKINKELKTLLDDMLETMRVAPGVGLAGPQVGVSKRIIVVEYEDDVYQLINPEIVKSEGWVQGPEGCLSIPGFVGDVYRYEKVRVVALDRNGAKVWIDAEGWLARIFQHEIDHLDGIMYTDKASHLREVKPGEEDMAEGAEETEAESNAATKPLTIAERRARRAAASQGE